MMLLAGVLLASALLGALLDSRPSVPWRIAVAWCAAAVTLAVAAFVLRAQAPFARMLGLVAATLLANKAVVAAHHPHGLGPWRWAMFCVWPGMDPRTLARRGTPGSWRALALEALGFSLAGATLLAGLRVATWAPAPAFVLAFAGSSLLVHFGVFALFTAALRGAGFRAERLFRAPWRSTTTTEFWSRRWNLGFVELCALSIARPLRRRCGVEGARYLTFLWSGVLHEIAITVPVRAGYGGPTGYFALQAVAALVERRWAWRGRLWTWSALLLPAPLLFPPAFREMVVQALR